MEHTVSCSNFAKNAITGQQELKFDAGYVTHIYDNTGKYYKFIFHTSEKKLTVLDKIPDDTSVTIEYEMGYVY